MLFWLQCMSTVIFNKLNSMAMARQLFFTELFAQLKRNNSSRYSKAGVPSPQSRYRSGSAACQEAGCTARGVPLPIAPHRSPSLTLLPEPSPPTPICGKIVFHETGPWCQKGWGPLLQSASIKKPMRSTGMQNVQDGSGGNLHSFQFPSCLPPFQRRNENLLHCFLSWGHRNSYFCFFPQ